MNDMVNLIADTGLYTAVLGDILDRMGFVNQFLPADVRPLDGRILVGRAMPVQLATATKTRGGGFEKLTEALDQLEPGEVYLATGGTTPCAAWGELMTTTARVRGAAGAVINGYHRDTARLLTHQWPIFSRGAYAQDASVRSVVIDYRAAIDVEGVEVRPGDLVVGDLDGVLIVPSGIEEEVIERAIEKMRAEDVVRESIAGGMSASQAFADYGVL